MLVLRSYVVAVIFCVITMLCWGSWANTQKLVSGESWPFQLFYWDYGIGVLLMGVIFALTLGSFGSRGRNYLADLRQAQPRNLWSAFLGGIVFNAANILLVGAIDIAGMSVAFPVGIGLALVIGVLINYWAAPKGNPIQLFTGVALIAAAIIVDALAYSTLPKETAGGIKGIVLAVLCGLLMGSFYRFVAKAMSPDFEKMEPGKVSPYTAMVLFSLGLVASNFIFNAAVMRWPFSGESVAMAGYFQGSALDHLWGVAGGMIWAVGMTLSIIAFGRAGPAISYGLGQGATMVAAFWGVFIWHEFSKAPPMATWLLAIMFVGYFAGLALVILAGRSARDTARVVAKTASDGKQIEVAP
jgi:glucose uptake protein